MRQNPELRLRVGTNIKRLRLLRGKTREYLAERLDITPRHLVKLEGGRVNIGVDVMGNAALVLK